jgi:hypothetical protein
MVARDMPPTVWRNDCANRRRLFFCCSDGGISGVFESCLSGAMCCSGRAKRSGDFGWEVRPYASGVGHVVGEGVSEIAGKCIKVVLGSGRCVEDGRVERGGLDIEVGGACLLCLDMWLCAGLFEVKFAYEGVGRFWGINRAKME